MNWSAKLTAWCLSNRMKWPKSFTGNENRYECGNGQAQVVLLNEFLQLSDEEHNVHQRRLGKSLYLTSQYSYQCYAVCSTSVHILRTSFRFRDSHACACMIRQSPMLEGETGAVLDRCPGPIPSGSAQSVASMPAMVPAWEDVQSRLNSSRPHELNRSIGSAVRSARIPC